jgi:hypothetical protein
MKRMILNISYFFIVFLITSCKNEDFFINGTLTENYATFCVLDNRNSTQLVRINKIYFNEDEKGMPNSTRVILQEVNGPTFTLRDTTLSNSQKESIYYLPIYKIKRGKSYKLTVTADDLPTQTASVYVFAVPKMTVTRMKVWNKILTDYDYSFRCTTIKERTPVYLYTAYIEVERRGTGKSIIEYMEMPASVFLQIDLPADLAESYRISRYGPDTVGFTYPTLSIFETKYYSSTQDNVTLTYNTECIRSSLKMLQSIYGKNTIYVRRGIFVMYIIDESIYRNFIAPKSDRYSVRLDESYFTTNFSTLNGKQPMGYLGCVVADTAGFDIYSELLEEYQLLNGQD